MNREDLTDHFCRIPDEVLPIFSRAAGGLTLFYAPGYLAAADAEKAREIRKILAGEIPFGNPAAAELISAAGSALAHWERIRDPESYCPVCLTLYTTLACSLKCEYCFAEENREPALFLEHEFIRDSARMVLANCKKTDMPFTAVFQGGGEPSLDPRLPEILAELRELCGAEGVPFFSYIATNGVMEEEKARWIAEHFDAVGLSLDGPPEIQDTQRPLRTGGGSSQLVERTAAVLKRIMGRLNVRVTVRPQEFTRIGEITAYLADHLHADEIHLEPAYCRGAGPNPEQADLFCEQYLSAVKKLRAEGVRLTFSGSRIGEIHGRYCQIFRQVLHLVPPDGRSACFAVSSRRSAEYSGLALFVDNFLFDELSGEDPGCTDCFNRFHCARGCPDVCPMLPGDLKDAGSFRCRVSRTLAEAELLDIAERCLFEYARKYGFAGMDLRGK